MATTASRRQASGPYIRDSHIAALRRAAFGLLGAALIVAVAALLAGAALLVYGATYRGEIFGGARAAGVDLGGKTQAEAAALIDARLAAWTQQPLQFTANGQTLTATPAELGVSFNAQAIAANAYNFGRGDGLWADSRNWLDALTGGYTTPAVATVDAERFKIFFAARAADIAVAPRDASFALDTAGRSTIDPGAPGVAIDLNATLRALEEQANTLATTPVAIATTSVPQAVVGDDLRQALADVATLTDDPLTLSLGGAAWQIDSAALRGMLRVDNAAGGVAVAIDRSALREYVASLENSVFTSGVDATIVNNNGSFVVTSAVAGRKLDINASTDAALAALASGGVEVQLVTRPVTPQIGDAAVAEALATAQKLTASDITLTYDSGTETIGADKLAQAVRFGANAARKPQIEVTLDQEQMGKAFAQVADKIKVEGKNADLRWIDGAVQVRANETPGRELDVQATIDATRRALAAGGAQVAAVTKDLPPAVTAAMAPTIQIREMLTASQTYYGDSAAERFTNVELATSRVNGAMIPPGGTFSFNQAIGEVSYASGYKTGYGIVASGGIVSTVPSVGGGICQVATTVFQAMFKAGLPVVERYPHSYWIPRYGQQPYSMTGLDAAVDPDYGLDLRLVNTTNEWIALKGTWDGQNTRFELWGTNTGWDVQIDQPVVTNVVPASQEMVYEQNSALPAGKTVVVERAADGFSAAIRRVVRKDGQIIDEMTLNSTYVPARNVTLIGTG